MVVKYRSFFVLMVLVIRILFHMVLAEFKITQNWTYRDLSIDQNSQTGFEPCFEIDKKPTPWFEWHLLRSIILY